MTADDFRALPRRRPEFVPAHQRHKILPPGIYRGDASDTAFFLRRRVPDGLASDATITDCIAELLRVNGSMSVADIARRLNEDVAIINSLIKRAGARFVQVRAKGENGRGILWALVPDVDDPTLVERIAQSLSGREMPAKDIAAAIGEPSSLVRLALRRSPRFAKCGKPLANKTGTLWRLKKD